MYCLEYLLRLVLALRGLSRVSCLESLPKLDGRSAAVMSFSLVLNDCIFMLLDDTPSKQGAATKTVAVSALSCVASNCVHNCIKSWLALQLQRCMKPCSVLRQVMLSIASSNIGRWQSCMLCTYMSPGGNVLQQEPCQWLKEPGISAQPDSNMGQRKNGKAHRQGGRDKVQPLSDVSVHCRGRSWLLTICSCSNSRDP